MIYIAFALLLIGIVIVSIVIFRKLPLLTNIDIQQIAAERQAEVKRRIINEKLKRQIFTASKKLWHIVLPILAIISKLFVWLYNKLVNLKAGYEQVDKLKQGGLKKHVSVMLVEAEDWFKQGETAKAENKLIEIIGLDSKNYRAFTILGEIYLDKGGYQEAEESFNHAAKLLQQKHINLVGDNRELELAKIYFNLSEAAMLANDNVKALANIKKSLELEPNSPRLLDKACEICLNLKDGSEALEYCRDLERVNPGNKKLKEIKDDIRDLAKETDRREVEQSVNDVE